MKLKPLKNMSGTFYNAQQKQLKYNKNQEGKRGKFFSRKSVFVFECFSRISAEQLATVLKLLQQRFSLRTVRGGNIRTLL